MTDQKTPTRVLFSCSGVGIFNRGIESFFREAFDALKQTNGLCCHLLKGAGEARHDETVVWNLPRTHCLAGWLGKLARRNAYVVEQWSSFFSVARHIRRNRPEVVFYSDSNLGFLLYWRRRQIGVPYRLLFSNGGPVHPPFARTDFVHQVAPRYHEEALAAGEPSGKHFFVPYGIQVKEPPHQLTSEEKRALRLRLSLPTDRTVVLSVGWISREHKRMHYVIEEVASLPKPRPFLQLLGAMDATSNEIVTLGERLLGANGFAAKSVPYEKVFDFYRAADCFVLGSLQEGFGRVYLEALMHGLPVIAHKHPVMEFVLGGEGMLGDLTVRGELATLLVSSLSKPLEQEVMLQRWQSVRDRFGWEALRPGYCEMFQAAANNPLPAAESSRL